jgi:electron transport complex protein RnfD
VLCGPDFRETLTAVLGSVLFVSVFSATDPVTSPVIPAGRLIYGAGCGILAMALYFLFRINGTYFAIPVMNLLSKPIDDMVLRIRMKKSFR